MGFRKEDFIDCVGAVSVLLNDRVVLQGQIIKDREEERKSESFPTHIGFEIENQFITLELICGASIIRDNGNLETIDPSLFAEGDRVRINVVDISAIGPSHGCSDDDDDDDER